MGFGVGSFGILGIAGLVLSVAFGIIALVRRAQPRWPAIVALAVTGIYLVVFCVFLVWAMIGLTQIMFLPTH